MSVVRWLPVRLCPARNAGWRAQVPIARADRHQPLSCVCV